MKKLLSSILCLATIFTMSTTAFAADTSTTSQSQVSVDIITDQDEITQTLKEKGIYDETEDVVAVINANIPEPTPTIQPHLIFREIYAVADGSYDGTEYTAKYTNNYPAGTFHFNQSITSGWQLNANLGLKVEVFEAALGYTLNSSKTESWTYDSPYYDYPFTVKAYINYEQKYYKIYDKDLMFDDYIGRTSIERETGYTLKVFKQ